MQRLDCAQLVYRHLLCGAWQVTPTGAIGAAGLRLSNKSAAVCGEATLNAFGSASSESGDAALNLSGASIFDTSESS
jgi:hypothetical protein